MQNLEKDLVWFEHTFTTQIKNNLLGKSKDLHPAPNLDNSDAYGAWVSQKELNVPDRLMLLLALLPQINPSLIDHTIQKHLDKPGDHPELGGLRGTNFRGFIPTGETALFLLGGSHVKDRLKTREYIEQQSQVFKKGILTLGKPKENEPKYSGCWEVDLELFELLALGKLTAPEFSLTFPAKLIDTKLDWKDLVLDKRTRDQLYEVSAWLQHKETILKDWGLESRLKAGYKALFHGASGTGKTLAASLLGKQTNTPVYRIDLSMVVSKYIGETEKNLSRLFDRAENKNWILFFDEADALFGKRTSVRDAHDKYANQEVSYLLQRVEEYEGLVILASNLKGNIDTAFIRRFQSIVHFPTPGSKERLMLWQKMWPEKVKFENKSMLKELANKHELTGANILNVIQYACLKAAQVGKKKIGLTEMNAGVSRELRKEGKIA
jgi:hypothetical protein